MHKEKSGFEKSAGGETNNQCLNNSKKFWFVKTKYVCQLKFVHKVNLLQKIFKM